jgi:acetyl esterase/lipase
MYITNKMTMKKLLLLPLLLLFLTTGCSSDDDKNSDSTAPLAAEELFNVAYGSHNQQKMDVYLPENRTDDTKVIILVHGGSWVAGQKEDMNFIIPTIKSEFPNHAIVNMNYRLASAQNPAYPMQVDDIKSVIEHLEESDYTVSDDYAFIGISAGGHLSMLYSYKYDTDNDVKAVVNIVGPADFTDPAYAEHPLYQQSAITLLGTANPTAEQIEALNPVAHITAQAPPTLSFFGGQDPLIPSTQGPLLKAALDEAGVYNEYNFYPDGGHGDWNIQIMQEVFDKTITFLSDRFE